MRHTTTACADRYLALLTAYIPNAHVCRQSAVVGAANTLLTDTLAAGKTQQQMHFLALLDLVSAMAAACMQHDKALGKPMFCRGLEAQLISCNLPVQLWKYLQVCKAHGQRAARACPCLQIRISHLLLCAPLIRLILDNTAGPCCFSGCTKVAASCCSLKLLPVQLACITMARTSLCKARATTHPVRCCGSSAAVAMHGAVGTLLPAHADSLPGRACQLA